MQTRHEELRDELVAIMGASRELSPDTDKQLAEAFIRYLEEEPEPVQPEDTLHQPHYSLKLAGGVWGAGLMFLFLLLVLDNPTPETFLIASVVILSLIAALTRGLLYLARHGWTMPNIRVSIAPPSGNARNRG